MQTLAAGRRHGPPTIALSFGGVAFTAVQLIVGTQMGLFPIPAGDELVWDRVGDAVWSGAPIYFLAPVATDSFWYAPPVAIVFGLISWLPIVVQHVLFTIAKIAALRVIAGSWVGAGLACWFPFVAFELGGGNFNLLIAASIVAAIDRRPELAVLGALAKIGPILAIDPRDWRRAGLVFAVLVGLSLPWLHLWPAYLGHLAANVSLPLGPQVPVPLAIRLTAAAALLVLVRRRWARALAAAISIPAFYWTTIVTLLAPVAIAFRDSRRSASPAGMVAKVPA